MDPITRHWSWLILLFLGQTAGQNSGRRTACLNDFVSVECSKSEDCIIRLLSAEYGFPKKYVADQNCSAIDGGRMCFANATDVWHRCQDQASCEFYVHQERPSTGDCRGLRSVRLDINYQCQCADRCSELPGIANGHVTYDNPYLNRGSKVTYTCDPGYVLMGSSSRECVSPGEWTGVQPSCSIPTSECAQATFSQTSFGDSCYEMVKKSRNWTKAVEDCRMKNGTLLFLESEYELNYLKWWLTDMKIYGYVWAGNIDNITLTNPQGSSIILNYPYLCPQLVRNRSTFHKETTGTDAWFAIREICSVKNKYICEYEMAYVPQNQDEMVTMRKKDLILGLGVGLSAVMVLVILVAIVASCRKRHKKTCNECNGCDDYDSVGDPEKGSYSTHPSVLNKDSFNSRSVTDRSVGSSNDGFSDVVRPLPGSPSEGGSRYKDDTSLYDDVYVSGNNAESSGKSRDAPKIPRRVQLEVNRRGAHRNVYENVLLHNLTESLKRKFLPKRLSSSSSRKSSRHSRSDPEMIEKRAPVKKNKFKKHKYVNEQSNNCVKQGPNDDIAGHIKIEQEIERTTSDETTETDDVTTISCDEADGFPEDVPSVHGYRESDNMEIFENELYDRTITISEDRTEL